MPIQESGGEHRACSAGAAASRRTWIPSSRHVSGPGFVVLDITTADEETALAPMDGLQQLWAASGTTAIRRDPAQPGARARVHADIRRTNPRCPCTVASLDAAAGGPFAPPGIQMVSVWVC